MTDLDKLIEAVEGGAGFSGLQVGSFDNHCAENIVDAYHGSLDAAKALHDALLPGWWVSHFDIDGVVQVKCDMDDVHGGASLDNPARAWLTAILKAYRGHQ